MNTGFDGSLYEFGIIVANLQIEIKGEKQKKNRNIKLKKSNSKQACSKILFYSRN